MERLKSFLCTQREKIMNTIPDFVREDLLDFIKEARKNKGDTKISLTKEIFTQIIPPQIKWVNGAERCNIEIIYNSNNLDKSLIAFEFEFKDSGMSLDLWLGKEWNKYKNNISLFLSDLEHNIMHID